MQSDKTGENFNGMGTMEEEGGLHLLKKGQKGLRYALFSRVGIMFLLLLLQVMFLFGIFRWFDNFLPHLLGGALLFNVCMVLYLINSPIDPTAKITWLIVIMLFPVFGALLFWYTQSEVGHRAVKKRLERLFPGLRGYAGDVLPDGGGQVRGDAGAAAAGHAVYFPGIFYRG